MFPLLLLPMTCTIVCMLIACYMCTSSPPLLIPAGAAPVFAGVMVTGPRPLVLIATRGTLKPHDLASEGHLVAATPFDTPLCPHVH